MQLPINQFPIWKSETFFIHELGIDFFLFVDLGCLNSKNFNINNKSILNHFTETLFSNFQDFMRN